jgi:hypothetical protein
MAILVARCCHLSNFSDTTFARFKGQPGKFGYRALFCQSYRCNRCRNPKLKKMRARITEIATQHKLQHMATLTLDPSQIEKGARTDRYIRKCWRKMRVSLTREFGESLAFVGVLEFHKSGIAYLSVYLVADKVKRTVELLPKRARTFTTSRSIVLWGKKKASGWQLRREGTETFYNAAPNPSNVRFEPVAE